MYAGVDGCKRGWVCVVLDDGGFREALVADTFGALLDRLRDAAVIAVDIPVGLVDGPREADLAARGILKGRASSVFVTPPRAALEAATNDEAQARAREHLGHGVSRQALALAPKIFDVDKHAADPRIHEVHPEVSLCAMNGGTPLASRKKTWGGLQARLRLLHSQGIELPESLAEADAVGIDDVVDAAVAAWSARRIARGEARSFPDPPTQHDPTGRPIAIWA